MNITAFDLAQRFIGIKEVPGKRDNLMILSWLSLDAPEGVELHDEIPNCSTFPNFIAWLLRLPRSKSWRARSWLTVGREVEPKDAEAAFDVVILSRGEGEQPGPEVIAAPGHVGFFAGWGTPLIGEGWAHPKNVLLLGANQNDQVSVARFPSSRILGIRRLA